MQDIFKYPFFESCGKPIPEDLVRASNWQVAVQESTSRKWKNCRLAASNTLFDSVQRKNWFRGQEWNPLVEELRPLILAFVDRLLPKVPLPEEEFRDVVEPFFCIPIQEPWYAAGHFPCGWDGGEFPEHWDGVIRDGRL